MSLVEIIALAHIALAMVVMIWLSVIAWVNPKRLVHFFFKEVGESGGKFFVCRDTEEPEQERGKDGN